MGNEVQDTPTERQPGEFEDIAEIIGAIDAETLSHFIGEEYSSTYMSPTAKKINDKMFMLNGMDAWNRSMRIAATKAAVSFLQKHKGLPDKVHSARWLEELGLTPDDVITDADGKLVVDRHAIAAQLGVDMKEATARAANFHFALNRWVEGAILTPNAAQRPSWSSDPRYGMFFHLKQFSYSFHQTIMKRAVGELKQGNLTRMGTFAWYIPVMIAADITKGLLQGGGSLPGYMQNYDAGDWFLHGAQRAGLAGIGSIGMDAHSDLSSLAGPAVEQMVDAVSDSIGKTAVRALPVNALYRNALPA